MAFCPNCGKETKKSFCVDCRPGEDIIVKKISVRVCSRCNKFFFRNKWTNFETIEKALIKFAKDKILTEERITLTPVIPQFTRAPNVKVLFHYDVVSGTGALQVPAEMHVNFCDRCAQEEGSYFEGTLQLRHINDEAVLDFAEKYVRENNIHIAKKTDLKNGYDLDISDQRKLQNLGHLLEKNFGGKTTISIRQFTQDKLTSKQIYRVNALYEGSPCKKGEVVKIDKNLYLITNIRKNISAMDLKREKKATIELVEREYEILPIIKTTVSKIYPNIEVFEPESYQSVPVHNKADVKMGEKVKVVNDSGIYYLV